MSFLLPDDLRDAYYQLTAALQTAYDLLQAAKADPSPETDAKVVGLGVSLVGEYSRIRERLKPLMGELYRASQELRHAKRLHGGHSSADAALGRAAGVVDLIGYIANAYCVPCTDDADSRTVLIRFPQSAEDHRILNTARKQLSGLLVKPTLKQAETYCHPEFVEAAKLRYAQEWPHVPRDNEGRPIKVEVGMADAARLGITLEEWRAASARRAADQQPRSSKHGNAVVCHVTLQQMAAIVNKSKRTLERLRDDGNLPAPAVKGGKGKADEWRWSDVRPILDKEYGRQLPEVFPSDRFVRR